MNVGMGFVESGGCGFRECFRDDVCAEFNRRVVLILWWPTFCLYFCAMAR